MANFQADLADLDAATASGTASRQLAASRELDSMSKSAALTAPMRAEVERRRVTLRVAHDSAAIA
jgi:hypothetical protein